MEDIQELFEKKVMVMYDGLIIGEEGETDEITPYEEIKVDDKVFLRLHGDEYDVENTRFGVVNGIDKLRVDVEKAKKILKENTFIPSVNLYVDLDCFNESGERIPAFKDPILKVCRFTDDLFGLYLECASKYDNELRVNGELLLGGKSE